MEIVLYHRRFMVDEASSVEVAINLISDKIYIIALCLFNQLDSIGVAPSWACT